MGVPPRSGSRTQTPRDMVALLRDSPGKVRSSLPLSASRYGPLVSNESARPGYKDSSRAHDTDWQKPSHQSGILERRRSSKGDACSTRTGPAVFHRVPWGSGRGHPLSGTWETWMAPNVVFRTILDLAAERIAQHLGAGGVSVLRVKLTSRRCPILRTSATVLLED